MVLEHPKEQHESPMERFRKEIAEFALREKRKADQWEYRERDTDTYNRDAADIETEFLTEDDLAIWEKIKNGTITFPAFYEYGNAMEKELQEAKDNTADRKEYENRKKSREAFRAIAADKAQLVIDEWLLKLGTKYK